MSCSICRLPFVPCEMSANPLPAHFPPPGTMSNKEYSYFEVAFTYGRRIMGAVARYQYCSSNVFGALDSVILQTLVWSIADGSFFMMHTACSNIFRAKLGCEANDLPACSKLSELEIVLGYPMIGADAGRFKDVQYESVGDRIDLKPFWHVGNSEGENVFDFKALKDAGMDWLLARPDVFPRFFKEIKPERQLEYSEDTAPKRTDLFTTMPMDLLHVLIEHLPPKSYVQLMATCRFLRHHALTTFQPHARRMVCDLGWAIALSREVKELGPSMQSQLARASDESPDGDWLLYLSHVHRTRSMRARRWIWSLADEVKRVYEEKRPGSIFGDDYSTGVQDPTQRKKERKGFRTMIRQMYSVGQPMPGAPNMMSMMRQHRASGKAGNA
ncbi:hypothetical protein OF83DRAFT_1059776 [Amylostereum chailletii]|nr:hypothetical protein OF83DRAFT_1059776 [Amylostereum chailletii]